MSSETDQSDVEVAQELAQKPRRDAERTLDNDAALQPDFMNIVPQKSPPEKDLKTPLSLRSDSIDFHVLDILTYSVFVTRQSIAIIMASDSSFLSKAWALCALINNFMNSEGFFFIDLIFVSVMSLYNFYVSTVAPVFFVYVLAAFIVNIILTWYFAYCRALNGKDVITLRRSIQLLSHLFQLTTIGILVLCDGSTGPHSLSYEGHVYNFYCSTSFVFFNYFKLFWHSTVLLKTALDEYLSGFAISRGVALDFCTIVSSPILMAFSLITAFYADDVRQAMIRYLGVTYEVNDITNTTPFYNRLQATVHSSQFSGALLLLILRTTGVFNGMNMSYQVGGADIFDVLVCCMGGSLMAENFLCGTNKFCTIFIFLIVNFISKLLSLKELSWLGAYLDVTSSNYVVGCTSYAWPETSCMNCTVGCFNNVSAPSGCGVVTQGFCSDCYATCISVEVSTQEYCLCEDLTPLILNSWGEMVVAFLLCLYYLIFHYQREGPLILGHKLLYALPELLGFYLFVFVYCPLQPLLLFFRHKTIAANRIVIELNRGQDDVAPNNPLQPSEDTIAGI